MDYKENDKEYIEFLNRSWDWYRDRANRASDLLREVVCRYCVDISKEDLYEYGCIPINANGDELMLKILDFLGVREGQDEHLIWPEFIINESEVL